MNKRQKKKADKKEAELNPMCPECGGWDGIIGHFFKGKKHEVKFLYCDTCFWELKNE